MQHLARTAAVLALTAITSIAAAGPDDIASKLGIEPGPPGYTGAEERFRQLESEILDNFRASKEWGDLKVIEKVTETKTEDGVSRSITRQFVDISN